MRPNRDLAKSQVEAYGQLLREYAVITDIERSDNARDPKNPLYTFMVNAEKYPFPVTCTGIKELALVLTTMWSSFEKARSDLGFSSMYAV